MWKKLLIGSHYFLDHPRMNVGKRFSHTPCHRKFKDPSRDNKSYCLSEFFLKTAYLLFLICIKFMNVLTQLNGK